MHWSRIVRRRLYYSLGYRVAPMVISLVVRAPSARTGSRVGAHAATCSAMAA